MACLFGDLEANHFNPFFNPLRNIRVVHGHLMQVTGKDLEIILGSYPTLYKKHVYIGIYIYIHFFPSMQVLVTTYSRAKVEELEPYLLTALRPLVPVVLCCANAKEQRKVDGHFSNRSVVGHNWAVTQGKMYVS